VRPGDGLHQSLGLGLFHAYCALCASFVSAKDAVGFDEMDDKSLPPGDLPVPAEQRIADAAVAERRAFFRRAVAVGIPVVLATVRGRTVYARQLSGCGSLQPSGACTDLTAPEGDVKPKKPKG